MKARFRIRQGDRELRAETLQEFEELVRSGRVAEDDLVHDALTGEFAPARTHPAYQLVQETSEEYDEVGEGGDAAPATEVEEEGDATPATEVEAGADPQADPESAGDADADAEMEFPVELVEEEAQSAEEKAQAFIEEMERERQAEREQGLGERVDLSGLAPAAPRRPPPSGSEAVDVSGPRPFRSSEGEEHPFRAWGPADEAETAPSPPTRASTPESPGRRRRIAGILAAAVVVLAVTAAVAHPAFRFQDTLPAPESAEVEEAPSPEPPPPLTDRELRTSARVAFLDRVESLRDTYSLGRVPAVWLEGRYLAEASAYPQVERFWTDYLRYVEEVYAEEDALYRDAYLDLLSRMDIDGPVRSLRLARATADFQVRAVERHDLYAQVWELAVAARSLHQFLVENEGSISWEPAASERLSADPVTEAVGADEETQARLDEALDRVLEALYVVTGDGRNVHGEEPDWLMRSLAEGGPAAFFPAQQ